MDPSREQPLGGSERKHWILVVDDSDEIRELYQMVIEAAGYEVECASSGGQALQLIRERRPDLIFSDVVMPGMDGLELMTHIRSDLAPPIPVVILSSGFDITEEEALRRGALMFVRKPVAPADLLDFIAFGLLGQRVDASTLARHRAWSTGARKRARDAAEALLERLDLAALTGRNLGQLDWFRSYFGVDSAIFVLLRDQALVVIDRAGRDGFLLGADVSERLPYCYEIIETGSSLVLADAAAHPSFAPAGEALRGIRFFAGAPLVAPGGIPIGVACLFDHDPRSFEAEDLMIVEHWSRRGSWLMKALASGQSITGHWAPAPGVVISSTLELVLDAELRLLGRQGGSLELAVFELNEPSHISSVLSRQPTRERLLGGLLGATRGAVFKRDRGPNAAQTIDRIIEELGTSVAPGGVGIASLSGAESGRLSAGELIRVAKFALDEAGGGVNRIVLRHSAQPPSLHEGP
jgi:CheY-like chemotaxis protein